MNSTFLSKDESEESEFQLKEHAFISSQFLSSSFLNKAK